MFPSPKKWSLITFLNFRTPNLNATQSLLLMIPIHGLTFCYFYSELFYIWNVINHQEKEEISSPNNYALFHIYSSCIEWNCLISKQMISFARNTCGKMITPQNYRILIKNLCLLSSLHNLRTLVFICKIQIFSKYGKVFFKQLVWCI